jgi:fucose permease
LQTIVFSFKSKKGGRIMSVAEHETKPQGRRVNHTLISALTFAMFFMFAMTTDAVGEIIKIAKADMGLTNIQASAFHWATMVAVAGSGIGLGFVADRFGRKNTIILGLGIYGIASALFFAGQSFYLYLSLLFVSGLAIGIFKTAALALIGDISESTEHHTRKMNAVEGFFGVGAIVGPLLVVYFSTNGINWTWLYLIAASLCALMIVAALFTEYPESLSDEKSTASLAHTLSLLRNKYALGFSFAIAMYVASEVAIFVWLPTFLDGYTGTEIAMMFAAYAVMIFFVLRAAGRFLGIWILQLLDWKLVMLVFTGLIFGCFLASALLGKTAAVFLLPISGLFMSMIYPTLNSKGISCFPKSEHGAIAGLILFFTAASAAFGPLLMAFVSDTWGGGDMRIGFVLATGFAGLLFISAVWNWLRDPAAEALLAANQSDYATGEA